MTTTPRERLESRLLALTNGGNRDKLAGIAVKAGIGSRQMANAITRRPVATDAYLRICAAIGMDPQNPKAGQRRPPCPEPGTFLPKFLGISFAMRRRLNGHSMRQAAKDCGLSASTLARIEAGQECGIGVVLKACAYCRRHPFEFVGHFPHVTINVPRETQVSITDLSGAT